MQEVTSSEQVKFMDNHQVMLSSVGWEGSDITQAIRFVFAQLAPEQVPLCPLWANINKCTARSPEDVLAKKVNKLTEFMNCTFLDLSRDEDNYRELPEVKVQ